MDRWEKELRRLDNEPDTYENLERRLDIIINLRERFWREAFVVKNKAAKLIRKDTSFALLYYKALRTLAPYDFDSYLLYMEKDRLPEKRFYLPRRKVLKVVVDSLQDLAERKITFLGVSLPPRVGKSTLCIFYVTWEMGRHPDEANLMSGYSDKLTDGFYTEVLNIITSDEYNWSEVFTHCQIQRTSAKAESINLNTPSRFPTLTCRSVSGTLTGAVEARNLLYTDDLVEDREESLSPERLENKYQAYLNQLVDRKLDGCVELMVGTRWNVYDPLGRIEEENRGNPKYKFIVIPALDENDESNFQYDYHIGFSTEYYLTLRARLDKNEWEAKYQGRPFIREGLVFPEEELTVWNGEIDGDSVVAVVDVAWGGGDSLCMPVGVLKDDYVYIVDVVFSNGTKDVTKPLVEGMIIDKKVQRVQFESNSGGFEFADQVDDDLRKRGIHCSITSKRAPNTKSKQTKILQYAPDIKRSFVFLEPSKRSRAYRDFFRELTTYTSAGRNPHDDAPDALAQLADFIYNGVAEVRVLSRSAVGL